MALHTESRNWRGKRRAVSNGLRNMMPRPVYCCVGFLRYANSTGHRKRGSAATQRVAGPFLNPVSLLICDEAYSGSRGGGGSPPWTNVTSITTRNAPDGFSGIGSDCEFEFRATAFNPSTLTVVQTGTARITGVECPEYYGQAYPAGIGGWSGSMPMIQTTIASGVYIDVDVVETDLATPDDFYDSPPLITAASDMGRVFKGRSDVSSNPQLCSPGQTCKQVHSTFNW